MVALVQDLFMTLLFAGTHHAMSPHTHGYAYIVCALFDNKF